MKRVLFSFVTAMILMIGYHAMAAETVYDIREMELEIAFPDNYSVITRDIPADEQILETYGLTADALNATFIQSNIYANALSAAENDEIVVIMTDIEMMDFSSANETILNSLANGLVKEYTNVGVKVVSNDIYHHSEAAFIVVRFENKLQEVHGLQYYTVRNGKAMNFTLRSYNGEISEPTAATFKKIIDSIHFYTASSGEVKTEDTPSFLYTDNETGVTFTVPENWSQEPVSEDKNNIDAKFVYADHTNMVYTSVDIWSQMPAYEKAGKTRADVDNSYLTKLELAEMYDVPFSDISMVTYNGIEFFKYNHSTSTAASGLEINVTITQLLRFENGWMYLFQFSGTQDDPLYTDFESLLKSVDIPKAETTSYIKDYDTGGNATTGGAFADQFIIILIVVLVVAGVVTAVVIIAVKSAKKKKSTAGAIVIYCRNCGAAIPADSIYCHKCGTSVNRERNI